MLSRHDLGGPVISTIHLGQLGPTLESQRARHPQPLRARHPHQLTSMSSSSANCCCICSPAPVREHDQTKSETGNDGHSRCESDVKPPKYTRIWVHDKSFSLYLIKGHVPLFLTSLKSCPSTSHFSWRPPFNRSSRVPCTDTGESCANLCSQSPFQTSDWQ